MIGIPEESLIFLVPAGVVLVLAGTVKVTYLCAKPISEYMIRMRDKRDGTYRTAADSSGNQYSS